MPQAARYPSRFGIRHAHINRPARRLRWNTPESVPKAEAAARRYFTRLRGLDACVSASIRCCAASYSRAPVPGRRVLREGYSLATCR